MQRLSIPEPPGFNELSRGEQIRYLQALWDSISERPSEVPVLQSHLDLAEQRLAQHRRDSNRAKPADELLDRLEKNTG